MTILSCSVLAKTTPSRAQCVSFSFFSCRPHTRGPSKRETRVPLVWRKDFGFHLVEFRCDTLGVAFLVGEKRRESDEIRERDMEIERWNINNDNIVKQKIMLVNGNQSCEISRQKSESYKKAKKNGVRRDSKPRGENFSINPFSPDK